VTVNLTSGHFCNGWNDANNVTINLAPGTYDVDQKLDGSNNIILNIKCVIYFPSQTVEIDNDGATTAGGTEAQASFHFVFIGPWISPDTSATLT
jgi:hypothetical protein